MIVLVGMSAREVTDRALLTEWAAGVGGSVAFLQIADPSLGAELTRLADQGVTRITLVGVSLSRLAPGVSWLRRIASHWCREYGGDPPAIDVAGRLLADPEELAALAAQSRPLSGNEPGLTSPAWEDVPRHRHQVLVCRGPRCTAAGSQRTIETMILAMMAHQLGDDDVLITHTGCQFPCNQAPVVTVQPDDVWYGGVDEEAARRIVVEHLVAGTPVAAHRLRRERRD